MICMQGLAVALLCAAAMAATVAPSGCKWESCKASFAWNETACACVCTLRADTNPQWFQQEVWGHFFRMPCSAGTYYNPKQCDCSLLAPAKNPTQNFPTPQTAEDPSVPKCLTLVDLQLNDTGFVDLTNNWMDARNISVEDVASAIDGKAAVFEGNLVTLPVFEYNDLTSTAQFELHVRPDTSREENVTQVIFSNACTEENEPSLALTYTPFRSQFRVTLATEQISRTARCSGSPDKNGWFKLVLAVEKSQGKFFINGEKCATEMQGGGPIKKSPCGLTIGGDPLASDDSHYFYGMLDYFTVKKHCVTV